MKKIMKKALSLVLALVMMLTLAPMTASAAVGDDIANNTISTIFGEATVAANSTAYFEMGSFEAGEYNFKVEGTGDFSVTPCQKGTSTWYAEGEKTTEAVNGVANAKLSVLVDNGNDNYGGFAITNNTDEEKTYTCTVELPEGTQGNPKAVTIGLGTTATVTVPAESQYFVAATLPAPMTEYILTITGQTGFGYTAGVGMPAPDSNGTFETSIAAYYGPATFAIINKTQSEQTYTLKIAELPLGSSAKPDEFVVDTTITKELDGSDYWYEWMPTEAGKLTFSVDENACKNGWVVTVVNDYTGVTVQKSNVWDDKATFEVSFDSYELIKVGVSVPGIDAWNELSAYEYGTGTVKFSTVFSNTTGSGDEGSGEDSGEGEGEGTGSVAGEEINENYYFSYTELGTGTVTLFPELGYLTTLYIFRAEEAGTYTVTITDQYGFVGYYGSNEWFPQDYAALNNETKTYTYTLNYTEAGAPALIGISESAMTEITITKAGEAEVVVIPEYNLAVSAEAYVYTGETSTLTYVNVDGKDTVVDKAVYASDGYYHLNDKTGPILMVNIYDELFSIANAPNTGKVVTTYSDKDGNIVGKDVWNDVLLTYAACADKDTGLYPLTSALAHFYQVYGEQQKLYAEDGFVGSQFKNGMGEDAWMFACMYVPNAEDGTIVLPPVVIDPIVKDEEGKVTATVATEEAVKNIIEAAKEEGKDVVIKTTTEGLTITIANEDLKDATAVKLDVKVEVKEDVKDTTVAKNENITEKNFVLKVEFAHEGKLPAEATIVIPVPEAISKAYKTLYYYQIMEDGTLKFVCNAPINSDGKAVVTQDHCSDYVLLTEKIVEEAEAPKTGDNTNFALWITILGLGVVAIAGSVVMKKREF